ncbi:hypothetical protein [Leptothoe spongobia]|uniref:Uncharacterized protein n=1 Tax=Leptothoe spongobia TAU-MAC 1115 TaxID=1967444 RepID=A0A947GSF3_9CYAN|nr:hypothetical protein [Leptothoe spongobia]MBT9317921.1 hypothetical protein [Leptothoe spongobia TAU-MAC 1115]
MHPNQSTDETQLDITELLQSIAVMTSSQDPDETQLDINDAVGGIFQRAAYEQIPVKVSDAIPGLEIFEDSDSPGSWFWEWAWGECQDGPHKNELEALVAFAKFSAELAVELGGDGEEEE